MKCINRILMFAASAVTILTASAQTVDRESLGLFYSSSYPQLSVPLGKKTFAVLENGAVVGTGNVVYDNTFALKGHTMKRQSNPEGADLIFNFTNLHDESPIEVERYDPKKKRHPIKIGKVVIDTRPKEEREGPHHARPGFACAYLYRDLSYYITISKSDGSVIYENFVSESAEYNSAWWPEEHLAVDSVLRASSKRTLANLIYKNTPVLQELVGSAYLMDCKKVTCYYGKRKRRAKGEDPYTEINAAVDKLKKGAELIKINEWDIESFKSSTAGCVDVWENALKSADMNNKEAVINSEVACGLNYNIAVYYMFCKEFDKAAKYFKQVVMLDKRFGDCRYFADNCDKWQIAKENYEKMMASSESAAGK